MGSSTEERPKEPPWLVRQVTDRLLDGLIGALIGQAGTVAAILGLIKAGVIRVTASDTGMVVALVVAASLLMFWLGVRLCVTFALGMISLTWHALTEGRKARTEEKADPAALKTRLKAAILDPASVPAPPPSPRERLTTAAWSVLVWLFVPRRFREGRGWTVK